MGTGDLVLNSSPYAENTSSQSFLGAGVPALSDAIALQQYEFEKLLVDQQLWSSHLATEHEAKIKETAEQVKENASELKKLLKGGDDISPKLNVEESFHERYIQDLEAHSKSPPQPSKSVSRLSSPNKYKEERKGSDDHSPRGHIRNPRASSYHTRYDELKGRDSSSYRSGGTRMRSSHRDRDRGRRRIRSRSRSRSIGRGRGRSKDRHRGRDKGRSRSRSRSKVRHRGRDRGRSRSRSRSKDRHRGRDRGRSRSRSRSKDRQRERDGGRSRSRSRSKDRHKGRDRGRSRSKSRSRKGRRYCNEDACSGRPELLISQSRDSKCRIPPRITRNHIVARSSDADDKCLSPSNDVLRHSSTDLSTKENSLARIVSTGEKNGAATAKQIEKEWIGVWNEKLAGESVKNLSTLRCPSNKLSGERITGEHNSKKSVTSKTTPVCTNSQTRDGKSFTTASRSIEMSGDSETSIDHQPIREEGEIVG